MSDASAQAVRHSIHHDERITIEPLTIKNLEEIPSLLPVIEDLLCSQGWLCLDGYECEEIEKRRLLLEIGHLLGGKQFHPRADADGLASVTSAGTKNLSLYRGTDSGSFKCHTDGSYLRHLRQLDTNILRQVGPPAYIGLMCDRPAANGGASLLVDTRAILEDLIREYPRVARALFKSDCLDIIRDDMQACGVPLFSIDRLGRLRVRYRDDAVSSETTAEAVSVFATKLNESQYRVRLQLRANQILLVNNMRLLHGREEFSCLSDQPRRFLRLWVADATLQNIPITEAQPHASFLIAHAYRDECSISSPISRWGNLPAGFTLSSEASARLAAMRGVPDF